MCCSLWGHKESNTIERLNRTELNSQLTLIPKQGSAPWRLNGCLPFSHESLGDVVRDAFPSPKPDGSEAKAGLLWWSSG